MEAMTELPLRYAYEFYADQHRWIRIFSTAEGKVTWKPSFTVVSV